MLSFSRVNVIMLSVIRVNVAAPTETNHRRHKIVGQTEPESSELKFRRKDERCLFR
jgi:hypothetical protein